MIDHQVTTTTPTNAATVQPQKDENATQQANTARRRPLPIQCQCGD